MIDLWFLLAIAISLVVGGIVGFHIRPKKYDGVITMTENNGTLVYSLVVSEDPELLANHKEALFRIIPPSIEDTLSRK